ncbi:MAG: hypothetical protein Q9227_002376 [Pyrenula ochraceoflavens]
MHLSDFSSMILFSTEISFGPDRGDTSSLPGGMIRVTFQPPDASEKRTSIEVPLKPGVDGLQQLDIVMHSSGTKGYDMGKQYNDWFSDCFGFEVMLAFIGENRREALGNMSPHVALKEQNSSQPWLSLSSLTSWMPLSTTTVPEWQDSGLSFADCGPFLVVSERSMENINARLPEDDHIDIVKFRPNLVISGAVDEFEEDFWGELAIGNEKKMVLTQNCGRCKSINIDYETGMPGKGESGKMFKKLMRDRRVDQGNKYSPVFGRYGFLAKFEGQSTLKVGEQVVVKRTNHERTKFGK